jgi:2-polyprenyl-3-methyl-5-hydroxy-6-metoxy-1,4-benzoquinol methylase
MKMNPNIPFCNDDFIKETLNRYAGNYQIKEGLSYATVKDYFDSCDNLDPISKHGDLKNVQRPWALKAILSKVPVGGKILEFGGGESIIAAVLSRLGYDVTVVDPYDGSGNGPTAYLQYVVNFPEVRFIRGRFSPSLEELSGQEKSFDAIYSISVIEHMAFPETEQAFMAMQMYLKPEGWSIHAVDHVQRGVGEHEFKGLIHALSKLTGLQIKDVDAILEQMNDDIDTYYLSAEAHNAWRMGKSYDEYPMRAMVSMQFVTRAFNFALGIDDVKKDKENEFFYLTQKGFCPACNSSTMFRSVNDWYRDNCRCLLCNSIPRERAIINVFNQLFPNWRERSLHESSPSNRYFASAVKEYSFSHFYHDRELGEFVNGHRNENLEELTFTDNEFDFFVCLDVLEHVFRPDKAIREMLRVTKPLGAVVFAVPIHRSIEKTIQRAKMVSNDKIEYILPAEYHGNPVGDGRSLVTWDYGQDFSEIVQSWIGEDMKSGSSARQLKRCV